MYVSWILLLKSDAQVYYNLYKCVHVFILIKKTMWSPKITWTHVFLYEMHYCYLYPVLYRGCWGLLSCWPQCLSAWQRLRESERERPLIQHHEKSAETVITAAQNEIRAAVAKKQRSHFFISCHSDYRTPLEDDVRACWMIEWNDSSCSTLTDQWPTNTHSLINTLKLLGWVAKTTSR